MKTRIAVIIGTRPEAIKMAPVILALREHPSFVCKVCVTGQHHELVQHILPAFGIQPDADLQLMQPSQGLAGLTARSLSALDAYLDETKPDRVLVQGDTTTVFSAALAAFYRGIPVGHIEAGLRTGNLRSPWPEEANRILVSRIADLHFAPTERSRQNLLSEQIPDSAIVVTGNPVIDALYMAVDLLRAQPQHLLGLPHELQPSAGHREPRIVLVTGHRRESFGDGFEQICQAIATLSARFPETHFVYPVHLNPCVREPVQRILGVLVKNNRRNNIHLISPLEYLPFVALMNRSFLVLTDSGGVQEEAPGLGKPVIVMRDVTERVEAVQAGTVRLVGTRSEAIVEAVASLLTNPVVYESMAHAHNPYGDGHAARRIAEVLSVHHCV